LLEFWAPWCEACSQLDKLMGSRVAEHPDRLVWIRANVEDCPSLRKRLNIAFLPTLIVFLKGTEVERIQGIPTAQDLHSFITRALQSCAP
jgi:thioredoxin-like negative regulator of GroEL